MNRREFLKSAASSVFSLCLLMPGAAGWAFKAARGTDKKRTVIVFLRGAVDGLNVVIPYADGDYYRARPSIAIPQPGQEFGALDLDGSFGLHPALSPLLPWWKDRTLAFVVAAGSPDPTRSHFDAQDYMESGLPGVKIANTGWLNRVLSLMPDNQSPVRAINFGPTIPRILAGPASVANVQIGGNGLRRSAVDRPAIASAFEALYSNRNDALGKAFREGLSARKTLNRELSDEMEMANRGAPLPQASFGKQLARLLVKDPTIQVAFIAFGGWDTHVNQGASRGQLANRLTPLGTGLAELVTELGDEYKDTVILVVSEFGRTAHENGNGGTDHGHGNMIWVIGGKVKGGRTYGTFSGLASSQLYEGRDLPVSTDFRSVIGAVLTAHVGLTDRDMGKIFPHFDYRQSDINNIINA